MEHLQHGMERKWQRHYRETRTTIAVGIMLLGFCLMLSLLLLWPQMLGSVVFNSRLAHHLIISEEDLWTCNSDYIKYVVDEPSQDERLLSFFMFNVTNPQEVFERGDRPHVSEVGPFAYKRRTYKYDIKFDPEVSKSMTFKEYEILDNVDDKESCTRMFFRMDRDHPSFGQQNCIGKECSCKDDNVEITTINPNFMKVTWEETAPIFLGRLSSEVFSTIQKLLTNEFIEATKAHLVKNAMEEIYYFRLFYQIGYILNTAYDNIEHGISSWAEIIIIALAYHINKEWIASVPNALENLIYKEWSNTFEPVSCSPLGHKCIWQWGHIKKMREKENMMNSNLHEAANMSYNLIKTIINPSTKASINPNNIEYDGNSAKFYNAYTYCSRIIEPKIIYNDCMDISYAQQAAYYDVPSGLFGVDAGISQINRTDTTKAYMDINDDLKAYYVRFGCDLSQLVYGIYRNSTTFHDEYVIRYINLHKDSSLTHTFSINNWDEIGIAQFAGGFITQAIVGVRALYEIVRDGMWRFGEFEYYKNVVEYSSWMTLQGFPHAWIYDIKNAKELLEVLASNTDDAVDFRAQLIRNHMTFIGNGKRFINEIGKKDEIVFIPENNLANFNCIGKYSKSCALLAVSFNSSAEHCEDINRMFQQCLRAIVSRNKWVTHCSAFETTITSPQASTIISCDYTSVDQNPHSYMRSRGNLLTKMLLDLVVKNVLNGGLWCQSHGNCKYNRGVWAAYPGLNNNNDIDFNKYMQCQKRLYGGLSNLFTSCDDTVETGTQQLSQVKNIRKFHGNSTIQYSNISFDVEGYTNRQFYPHLWKGFKTYPYVYDLLLSGEGFDSTSILSLFSKEHLLKLQLTQHDLSETYKSFDLKYPLPTTSGGGSTDDLSSAIGIVNVRRLADAASTYDYMASFSAPKDAYGMGYTVPKGMVSLQQLAGFPIFAGTPHHFGNQKWGGFEFREFTGLSPKADTQMSYVDYDPVSGRSFRTAFRQQVNIRVEKGPILRNVFSSQQRCISPTKVFSGGSGYGCFAYIPLLWFEDAKVENEKDFHKYYDHYVTRPIRHGIITYIGAGLGFIFLGTGAILYFVESVKRHKFQTRIFVD
eukprot:gene638-1231_t